MLKFFTAIKVYYIADMTIDNFQFEVLGQTIIISCCKNFIIVLHVKLKN